MNANADEPKVLAHYKASKDLFSSYVVTYLDGVLTQYPKNNPDCSFPKFSRSDLALEPFFCMEKKPGFDMRVKQSPLNTTADSYYVIEMH